MQVDGLELPALLDDMLLQGRWPRTADEARAQNLRPLVPREAVQRATNGDEGHQMSAYLYLEPPPFRTVATEASYNEAFWRSEWCRPDDIVFDLAVILGDFGLGSDAPIILDYRDRPSNPRVLRLRFTQSGNAWVEVAPDFAAFVAAFGL